MVQKSTLKIKELADQLIKDIQHRLIVDGDNSLPSEMELMDRYTVSRYSIRQALKQLSSMGYIYQVRGKGTLVRDKFEGKGTVIQTNIGQSEYMARLGKVLKTRKATIESVLVKDAHFLPVGTNLDSAEELWYVNRLRYLDGKPFILEHSYYLKKIIPKIPEEILYESIFDYIKNQGEVYLAFQDTTVLAELMDEHLADFFQQEVGAATLSVCDDTYLRTGELFAFSKLSYDALSTKVFSFNEL